MGAHEALLWSRHKQKAGKEQTLGRWRHVSTRLAPRQERSACFTVFRSLQKVLGISTQIAIGICCVSCSCDMPSKKQAVFQSTVGLSYTACSQMTTNKRSQKAPCRTAYYSSRNGPAIFGACRRAEVQQRERRPSVSVPRVGRGTTVAVETAPAADFPRRRSAAAIMQTRRQSARELAPSPECSKPLLGEAEKRRLSMLMQFRGSPPIDAGHESPASDIIASREQQQQWGGAGG